MTCVGSQEATTAATGDKATFKMPPLPNTPWAAAPDAAASALAARRLVLSERETALQQWAAALAIECSRRAKAAAVVTVASEAVDSRLTISHTASIVDWVHVVEASRAWAHVLCKPFHSASSRLAV